jgi:poly(A) polymerase
MLKRLINFFDDKTKSSTPSVTDGATYSLTANMISKDARKVVETLQNAGFDAYIVGGAVRDLLLGIKPKDFDVATNAEPAEVKSLFRRSRIIGRRFQIVHVQFNRELIEVTTFRSNGQTGQDAGKKNIGLRQQSKTGMLTRDNVFGSMHEDASRRDLTVNALYYNPSDNSIHDFTNGLDDINNRTIRIIGDPLTRYREDPVRLLRVVRFAAKLGFDIDSRTAKPMSQLSADLAQVSPPRLFDETLKLFMSGKGAAIYLLLQDYNLFNYLVPQASRLANDVSTNANNLFEQAFINTDRRISSNQRVTPAFIYAALLWPSVEKLAVQLSDKGNSASYALSKASSEVISQQIHVTAIPKRFTIPMREIWDLQLQLPRRGGQRAKRLSESTRFRAGYDFILLREQAGENLDGLGQWWTTYQEVNPEEQQQMSDDAGKAVKKKRRRRSPRKKKVSKD